MNTSILPAVLSVLIASSVPGVQSGWPQYYDLANLRDEGMFAVGDMHGNLIVTGTATVTGGNADIVTHSYASNGGINWTNRYESTFGSDYPVGIAVDRLGFVYVAGTKVVSLTDMDYVAIKISPDGTPVWTRTYNSGASDVAAGMSLAANGDVAVTGTSNGFSSPYTDIVTMVWDANGTPKFGWPTIWGAGNQANDLAAAVTVSSSSDVIVAGHTASSGTIDQVYWVKVSP